jgi:cysteine sulfinate desulfinase/cysteine desulfurase-like protein
VRFSLSRLNTRQELELAAETVIATVRRLRSLGPSAEVRLETVKQ